MAINAGSTRHHFSMLFKDLIIYLSSIFFLNTCLHEFMCTNAPGVSLWAEESLEEELELQAVVIHYMDDGN